MGIGFIFPLKMQSNLFIGKVDGFVCEDLIIFVAFAGNQNDVVFVSRFNRDADCCFSVGLNNNFLAVCIFETCDNFFDNRLRIF
jgi:hypothetical protein